MACDDWLEATSEACASEISTKICISPRLRLECMHDHVERDAWLQATCWSRRSEISLQNTRNNVGVSANRALLDAASPQRKLTSADGLSRGACAVEAQSQQSYSSAPSAQRQATRGLRARRVSGGAARSFAALRQRTSLLGRRGAAWQRSGRQRNRGEWQFATAETHLFSLGRWPATVRSQSQRATKYLVAPASN